MEKKRLDIAWDSTEMTPRYAIVYDASPRSFWYRFIRSIPRVRKYLKSNLIAWIDFE